MQIDRRGTNDRRTKKNAADERLITSRMISAEEAAREVLGLKEPNTTKTVRLVFYLGFKDAHQSAPSFKAYADMLSSNLGALKIPFEGNCKESMLGSTSCSKKENILIRAAAFAKCLNAKIDQLHVIGHIARDPPDCLAGSMTKQLAIWFNPSAKFVLHGCKGQRNYLVGRRAIFTNLPGATIYVHTIPAEAGGPLDFVKYTSANSDQKNGEKIFSIVNENVGFTNASVQHWANEHVNAAKVAQQKNYQGDIKIYLDWLILPAFFSSEALVFADTIIQDKSGRLPPGLVIAAKKFRLRYNKKVGVTP